jgi:class 3 adenylate cyclase/tetratricopeptide (TPR) repeat protein
VSFLDIIERAKAYLARHHRMSLRALRREFDLDDEAVEELVEELVQVQQVAVLDGEALAWARPTASPTPAAAAGTPVAPGTRSEEVAPSPPVSEAERRQLTVMFCDLVGSATLGQRLDSEDFRDIVRRYYDATRTVTDRWGGHVATYMGDGLLVYFGYPQAREDDAERAVRAGLEVVEALPAFNEELEAERGVRLAVRVGIHTGMVVVGELGRHGDNVALGDTMNQAARIEAAAEPDTVVCSSATLRLVSGIFVTRDLGARELKGIDRSMHLHQVVRPSGMRSRLDAAAASGLTPLVGRQQELGLLEDRWQQVTEGRGQAVLVSGEAGIGKSRLVQAFRERIADRPHTWLECRGSPYTQGSALYPVQETQRVRLGFTAGATAAETLERLEARLAPAGFDLALSVPVLARFHGLPIPDRYHDPGLGPEGLRRKTLALLVEWLLRLGREQPAILLVEDLHWLDPSTLELLGHVIEQLPAERVLLLLTCRPDFEPPWDTRSHLTPMLLSRLTRAQLVELIGKAARGRELPEAGVEELVRRSDGVPLFAEELTRAVIETSPLAAEDGAPPELRIPATLQDSLMARLDALGPAKELAQLASVLGREFDYGLLRAVSPMNDTELQAVLAATVRRELFYQRGTPPEATYVFKHALIRDAAYESMLRATRRRHHDRVAQTLIERMPHVVDAQPELLAHHHTEAGQMRAAIDEWHEAGRRSLQRAANKEATLHLKRALDLLATQPYSPARDREELDLQVELGSATMASQGWASPEGARCYARARQLCLTVGDERELFPILWGFWMIHNQRSELSERRATAAELLAIAERHGDPAMLLQAHHANWGNPFLGDFASQLQHVERGLSHYDPAEHSRLAPQYGGHDAGVCGHCHRGIALWATGYPERSGESFAAALALADEIEHPLSKAHPLTISSLLPLFRSDWPEAFRMADAAMARLSEFGMPTWTSMAMLMRGWALVALGEAADGLAQIRRCLKVGDIVGLGTHHAFYAEALYLAGATDEALAALDDALPLMERTGERLWQANAMALRGDLLLARGLHADAEISYRNAIEVARAQSARMWELRAATRLARLWHLQGKAVEARDLLAPLYGWFTEGFGTKDLEDAKALLEELERSRHDH